MFLGILSSIFSSFGTIFRKKALNYDCKPNLFSLFAFFGPIIIALYIIFSKNYNFSGFTNKVLLVSILIIILQYICTKIGQYAYKNEKISALMPYENINKIVSTILAFLLFGGTSYLAFVLTIFGGFVLTIFSIDFRNFKIPKVIKIFTFQQLLVSIKILIVGYILKKITSNDYYLLSNLLYLIVLLSVVTIKKEFVLIKTLDKDFYTNRFLGSLFGSFAGIIELFLISTLGISMTILFSYLYIGFTLILGYVFLKDIPTKKDIILTIFLSAIVGLGYYFN